VLFSSDPEKPGLAKTGPVGTYEIQATSSADGVIGSTFLTVSDAKVILLEVIPASFELAGGEPAQLRAQATYSDDTTADVTALATWSTSDPGVVAVSDLEGSKGVATALTEGTATVTAAFAGQSATAGATVTAPGDGGGDTGDSGSGGSSGDSGSGGSGGSGGAGDGTGSDPGGTGDGSGSGDSGSSGGSGGGGGDVDPTPAPVTFQSRTYAVDHGFRDIAVGELNGDGRDDVVIAAKREVHDGTVYGGGSVIAYGTDQGLSVHVLWQSYGPLDADHAVVGDLDLDGRRDVVLAGGGNLIVLRSVTSGFLWDGRVYLTSEPQVPDPFHPLPSAPPAVTALAIGNLDPAPANPIPGFPTSLSPEILATTADGRLAVLPNVLGSGGALLTSPVGSGPIDLKVADLAGDGLPDAVVANRDSNDVSVLWNAAGFLLGEVRYAAGLCPTGLAAAHLVREASGPQLLDLIVSSGGAGGGLQVLQNRFMLPQAVAGGPYALQRRVAEAYGRSKRVLIMSRRHDLVLDERLKAEIRAQPRWLLRQGVTRDGRG